MANITLTFPFPLNVSVQPTDTLYMSLVPGGQSGTNHPSQGVNTAPTAIGVVKIVNHNFNTVTYDDSILPGVIVTAGHYLYFSKDRTVNTSGVIGYFAETEYRNYSKLPAEIFATAVDYSESSK